jgi:hypothetical protein
MTALLSPVAVTRPRKGLIEHRTTRGEMQNRWSEGVCQRFVVCAPGGIRNPNLLIRSQMLYPLSYRRPSTHTGREDWTRIADHAGRTEIRTVKPGAETPTTGLDRSNRVRATGRSSLI